MLKSITCSGFARRGLKMRDSWKETMGKLLLLDADVIIDLHILGLFEKM